MKNTALFLFSSLFFSTAQVWGQANDRLLPILKQELKYNMEELKKKELPPYYMSFRVEDDYQLNINSDFGVDAQGKETHLRTIVPQIRLGSKELDNFKYQNQGEYPRSLPAYLPLADGWDMATRTGIWSETLKRYEFACQVYRQTQIQAATGAANEDKSPCFSDAPVEKYYEEPVSKELLEKTKKEWQEKLNKVSAAFRTYPDLQQGAASLDFQVLRTFFVNTEGTEVVQNHISARIMLSGQVVAADGMDLPLRKDYFAYSLDSLPDTERMIADVKDMITRLKALKDAPVADPYTGPAILSGAASGVFFHEIFGHRLEGHRLKKGGETFKKMIDKQVLPQTFQVYCDPLLKYYGGTALNGHYLYDEEGVKARKVDNVVNGILKSFLVSRVPLEGFPYSNGHGRASGTKDPVSRQSNLVVETSKPYSEADLRKMLIAEAKKQGKEYGYYYKTVTSGYTLTGEGGSLNSFNVTPLEVYRVFVDGRPDQLVRGVDLIGTPLAMFSKIVAGGDKPDVFTGSCGAESGWVPVTASSPMIYVSQIETQRRQQAASIPPILPPVAFRDTTIANTDELIMGAMKDELVRNQQNLKLSGNPLPFYQSYITMRYRQLQIMSTLGQTVISVVTPWRMQGGAELLLGNLKSSSMIQPNQYLRSTLQAQPEYFNLRRDYALVADAGYKYGLQNYAQKQTYLQSQPLPKDLADLPDMQPMLPISKIEQRTKPYVIDQVKLERIANELSAIFKDYKELFNTSVLITGEEIDLYRITSENVNLKHPTGKITLRVNASVRIPSGADLSNSYRLGFDTPDEMPTLDELKTQVKAFAQQMVGQVKLAEMEDEYSGPVMYEGEAVADIFFENLARPGQMVALKTLDGKGNELADKIGKSIVDSRISIKNYTHKTEYNGIKLAGCYVMDADGIVPETEMNLVEKGVFKQMLNGRTPVLHATSSTGSNRFGNSTSNVAPEVSVGTMHILAQGTTDQSKMKKMLIKAAKKVKKKVAYIVRLPQGYSSLQLYRVDVKTGEETQLCAGSMELPTLDKLMKLVAISSQEAVQNRYSDKVGTSVIYPTSIILGEVELTKSNIPTTQKPALKYPLQR